MASANENLYGVLKVNKTASSDEIKRSYQNLVKQVYTSAILNYKVEFMTITPRSLQYHPDKLPSSLSDKERASAVEQFHKIKRAYEILSDDKERQTYDTTSNGKLIHISLDSLAQSHDIIFNTNLFIFAELSLTQKWPISATLDLDEMTYDPETCSYSAPCRCGGCYVISEGEMERGVDTVNCSTCTLSIRVLYQEASDEDDQ